MAFELTLGRPLPAELARLLGSGIKNALGELSGVPDEAAVHAARRHIKKTRAVLRLLDGALQHRTLVRCDSDLRAAGRALSTARDAAVLLRTVDVLAASHPAQATATALQHLRSTLQPNGSNPTADADALGTARHALQASRTMLTEYDFAECDFAALTAGFAATYRAGRHVLQRAETAPTVDRLHALRKTLKHHVYQLRLLRPLWPGPLAAFLAEADHAAGLLGQHHDCAVLRTRLPGSTLSTAGRTRIDALAAQRQNVLAQAALAICRCLYAERARHYARRLHAYRAAAATRDMDARDAGKH